MDDAVEALVGLVGAHGDALENMQQIKVLQLPLRFS
jgi:hypothetical protein